MTYYEHTPRWVSSIVESYRSYLIVSFHTEGESPVYNVREIEGRQRIVAWRCASIAECRRKIDAMPRREFENA